MQVLIGSTNISKRRRFQSLLDDTDVQFITLADCGIDTEPEETGSTPEENARIKAAFYGKYHDPVICNDSGLYFKELSIDDPKQPGLNVRTPDGCHRLSDEEMISYYSDLIISIGGRSGRLKAYYLDGIAVCRDGQIFSFMDQEYAQQGSFYMIDKPSFKRHAGWPLDSLSVDIHSGIYFVDRQETAVSDNILRGEYRMRLKSFLLQALEI